VTCNPALQSQDWGRDPRRIICWSEGTKPVAHLLDRHFFERANAALLLSLLWGGLAACIVAALVYDVTRWFAD